MTQIVPVNALEIIDRGDGECYGVRVKCPHDGCGYVALHGTTFYPSNEIGQRGTHCPYHRGVTYNIYPCETTALTTWERPLKYKKNGTPYKRAKVKYHEI